MTTLTNLAADLRAELPEDLPPARRAEFESLVDPARWLSLAPSLRVGDAEISQELDAAIPWDDATLAGVKRRLVEEGYFQLPPPDWHLPIAAMADAVHAVVEAGHMPVMAFMYDETWLLFARLHKLIQAVLGADYKIQPAFWAWHVGGAKMPAGWRPHRDQDGTTLRLDRSPKSLTVWIPLTEATPANGCMYILPADRDPNYEAAGKTEIQLDLQDVRALPSPAGGVLGWTQAALHWGGRANPREPAPRISVSVEFQRADEAPLKQPLSAPTSLLGPVQRLKMILRQMIQYQHFVGVRRDLRATAEAVILRQYGNEHSTAL